LAEDKECTLCTFAALRAVAARAPNLHAQRAPQRARAAAAAREGATRPRLVTRWVPRLARVRAARSAAFRTGTSSDPTEPSLPTGQRNRGLCCLRRLRLRLRRLLLGRCRCRSPRRRVRRWAATRPRAKACGAPRRRANPRPRTARRRASNLLRLQLPRLPRLPLRGPRRWPWFRRAPSREAPSGRGSTRRRASKGRSPGAPNTRGVQATHKHTLQG
jgi:hypothetical protein